MNNKMTQIYTTKELQKQFVKFFSPFITNTKFMSLSKQLEGVPTSQQQYASK